MLRLFPLALAIGCAPEPKGHDPHRQPTQPDPVSGATHLVHGTRVVETEPGPLLVEGGVVSCADPTQRDAARYDTEWLAVADPAESLIESGGFVLADLDGDGLLDLVAAGAPPAFYRGADGGRSFVLDLVPLAGHDVDGMVGGSAADYDGDGDLDLFLTRWARGDVLLRNEGNAFVDVTTTAGVRSGDLRSVSSSWDDFDGDGYLDLFVGRYGDTPDLVNDPGLHGDASSLYRNNGDGTFSDLSSMLPAELDDAYTFMSGWYDVDLDGDRELFVVNDFGDRIPSRMLRNDGGTLVLDETALFHPNFEGMGLGVGDLNGDGLPDFLQTSVRTASLLVSAPSGTSDTGVIYIESATAYGLNLSPGTGSPKGHDWGWGAEIADLDNDGDQDAIATFGWWDAYFGNPFEHDEVFLWDGDTFLEVAGEPEWAMDWDAHTRGLAVFDLDGDGALDVLRRSVDAGLRVDRGRCGPEGWLEVALADGTGTNRHGVGARVEIESGGVVWTEWIGSGSSGMFTGGPPVAHFGLGGTGVIDTLCAVWPDGEEQCFEGVDPRQRVTIHRRAGP